MMNRWINRHTGLDEKANLFEHNIRSKVGQIYNLRVTDENVPGEKIHEYTGVNAPIEYNVNEHQQS